MTRMVSTYRVQLNSDFTFSDLERCLPYLKKLGIMSLYLSPIMKASPGSTHLYDVSDPTVISDELGGEDAFVRLCRSIKSHGMNVLVDFVPNHMTLLNDYLADILRRGRKSSYWNYFDILWDHPDSGNRVMLPILDSYPLEAIAKHSLKLGSHGHLSVNGTEIPVAEGTDTDDIGTLLEEQNFRLVPWFVTGCTINYRRFFAVNSLIAVNQQDEDVFRNHHSKIFQLIDQGLVDALRIDHVDGLMDPSQYTMRIKRNHADTLLFLEKILTYGEEFPKKLIYDGLTGYESMFMISSLFHSREGVEILRRFFREFTGINHDQAYLEELKLERIRLLFSGDLDNLTRCFAQAWSDHRELTEIPQCRLSHALALLASSMDRYRTYMDSDNGECDVLKRAAERAKKHDGTYSHEIDVVKKLLCRGFSSDEQRRRPSLRFQTFTGPVMAKSVEDCLFYRDVALLSLNEVGFYSAGLIPNEDDFHEFFMEMSRKHPQSMVTLSTHDSKMGEDLRSRYIAISHFPEEFIDTVRMHCSSSGISRSDLYLIMQVVCATIQSREEDGFMERARNYLIKALRESSLTTSWDRVNADYERECISFMDSLFINPDERILKFGKKIAFYGSLIGIAQTSLKFLLPGTADTYQGSEIFNMSFVDPDNRRKVSFDRLDRMLDQVISSKRGYTHNITDERLKLWLTWKLLHIRNEYLSQNDIVYRPLEVKGSDSSCVIAYEVSCGHGRVVVVVARDPVKVWRMDGRGEMDISIANLDDHRGMKRDLIRDEEIEQKTTLDSIMGDLPVAVVLLS